MQTLPSPMTIADYCAAIGRGEIKSNDDYQRSNKVWPPAARSFLIESIILGFPLPKIFLFQQTDLISKKTVKEIVDGQQRTKAIFDFFNNKLTISKTSELEAARGKKYDALDDDLKGRFLSYALSIDLFIAATPTEIRQAFRRLNSYTVPLNPEELRHAEYQGLFKWFIYELTRIFENRFLENGVFTEKQILRMQDEKLLSDCVFTFIKGWKTTKAKELESLYKNFDREFIEQDELNARIQEALDFIFAIPEIAETPLMKPHVLHTLIIAVAHYLRPIAALQGIAGIQEERPPLDRDICVSNLTNLADALDSDQPPDHLAPFVQACADKTNTEDRRSTRFVWLFKALRPELL